jgi:hypothetical protein
VDDKQLQQYIAYAVLCLVTYYILQMLVPYLFLGIVGLVIWRNYLNNHKP